MSLSFSLIEKTSMAIKITGGYTQCGVLSSIDFGLEHDGMCFACEELHETIVSIYHVLGQKRENGRYPWGLYSKNRFR